MKDLDIVGGVYREYVLRPAHADLFGSAGRAAAAIGPSRAEIRLHTAIGEDDKSDLSALAANYGITVRRTDMKSTLNFSYVHGLDPPRIFPSPHTIETKPHIRVSGARALCYGALDFKWTVEAEQAVYDPQDAFNAQPFSSTGSKVGRLALVLNEYEAAHLTRTSGVNAMIDGLFEIDGPEVVVLKRGAKGTIVATRDGERRHISPQLTPTVFKLGSGDVFSAMFAWAWMIDGRDAYASAELANQATAYYVATRTLPLPVDIAAENESLGIVAATASPVENPSVYLAGPFFTMTQLWLIEEARLYLREAGLKVFSPYHDVGLGEATKVATADLEALEEVDVVYAIVSGFDPGTMFEIGYARAIGKPVVVFVENEKTDDLKMLEGTDCQLIQEFASSIYRAAWKAQFPT